MLNFNLPEEITWLFALNFILIIFFLALIVNYIYFKFSDKKDRKEKMEELNEKDGNIIDKKGD